MHPSHIAIVVVILVLIIVLAWWILGVYNTRYPGPSIPDANIQPLINAYDEFATEFWFRENSCIFDKYLTCREQRFVVFESNGDVVYDSAQNEDWKCFPEIEDSDKLWNSVESDRAKTLTQGVVRRGRTNNLAELAKLGDRYRVVHISEYIYNDSDPSF